MQIYKRNQFIENGFISASKKHIKGNFPEHGHDFFEIEYVIKGSGTYIIDGVEYEICDNMLFFMSPASLHAVKNCDMEIINIMFSCHICDTASLFRLFAPGAVSATHFTEEKGRFIEQLLTETVSAPDTGYAEQFLRCVVYKLASGARVKSVTANEHIQSAIIYIMEKFNSNLTLNEIAEHLGLVPSYFSGLFKNETGMNFKTYLDNVRFEHAEKLLTFSNMPVSEICTASGFVDYANFARRFKAKYNCTPTGYRMGKHTL